MSGSSDQLLRVVIKAVQGEFEDKANELKDLMSSEAHKRTSNLANSMVANKISDTRYLVGVDGNALAGKAESKGVDYSEWYWKGRGAVTPKKAKWLEYDIDGKHIKSKYSRPYGGDPFVERAISKFK